MEKKQIISAIDFRVMNATVKDYALWTIGITNDPERRKTEHSNAKENVQCWMQWRADSEADARAIESYFIGKKMKGGTGGGNPADKPDFVYIF